jgi:hypothetical protein
MPACRRPADRHSWVASKTRCAHSCASCGIPIALSSTTCAGPARNLRLPPRECLRHIDCAPLLGRGEQRRFPRFPDALSPAAIGAMGGARIRNRNALTEDTVEIARLALLLNSASLWRSSSPPRVLVPPCVERATSAFAIALPLDTARVYSVRRRMVCNASGHCVSPEAGSYAPGTRNIRPLSTSLGSRHARHPLFRQGSGPS